MRIVHWLRLVSEDCSLIKITVSDDCPLVKITVSDDCSLVKVS